LKLLVIFILTIVRKLQKKKQERERERERGGWGKVGGLGWKDSLIL
jgi:hypothetical protein